STSDPLTLSLHAAFPISLLVLGLRRGGDDGWGSVFTFAVLGAAVLLLSGFLLVERRVREPMLPLSLFKIRAFTAAQVSAFAISRSEEHTSELQSLTNIVC